MFSIDKSQFGAFVSSLRKEKGITQKELAEKLYISDKAVSKWETGQSIPDVALLVPLAEILGVTVTELLECRRIENPWPISAEEMEVIVKKAVAYQDAETEKRKLNKKWLVPYIVCAAAALVQMAYFRYIFASGSSLMANVAVPHLLSVIFGAYFCLFAKRKLPAFYDENSVSFISDGVFRMNIPGVNFNNSNWPNIVGYLRLWCIMCMVFMPAVFILCYNVIIDVLFEIGLYQEFVMNAVITVFSVSFLLLTLLMPVYFIGKKYE